MARTPLFAIKLSAFCAPISQNASLPTWFFWSPAALCGIIISRPLGGNVAGAVLRRREICDIFAESGFFDFCPPPFCYNSSVVLGFEHDPASGHLLSI